MRGKSSSTANRKSSLRHVRPNAFGLPKAPAQAARLIPDRANNPILKTYLTFTPKEADELLNALGRYLKQEEEKRSRRDATTLIESDPVIALFDNTLKDFNLTSEQLKTGAVKRLNKDLTLDLTAPLDIASRRNDSRRPQDAHRVAIGLMFLTLDIRYKAARNPKRKAEIKAVMQKIAEAHNHLPRDVKSIPLDGILVQFNGQDLYDMNQLLETYMSMVSHDDAMKVDRNWANSLIPVWDLTDKDPEFIPFRVLTGGKSGVYPFSLMNHEQETLIDVLTKMQDENDPIGKKISLKMRADAKRLLPYLG